MVLPISKSSSTSSTGSSVSSLSSYTFSDDTVKSGGGGSSHGRSSHGGSGANAVKFLCSYGGKILPRYPEKNLRYVGGDTRVLAVDRSISFSELEAKMADLCGWGTRVALRCQLPSEDLDALVTVSSDEDLANIIEEYDLANSNIKKEPERQGGQYKIRAFLLPIQPPHQQQPKSPSSPSSAAASPASSDKGKSPFGTSPPHCSFAASSSSRSRRMSPPPVHHQHHRRLHHQHHHNHRHQYPQIPVAAAATPYGYHHVMTPVQPPSAASCRHPYNFPLAHSTSHLWQ